MTGSFLVCIVVCIGSFVLDMQAADSNRFFGRLSSHVTVASGLDRIKTTPPVFFPEHMYGAALTTIGEAHFEQGNSDKAIVWWRRALRELEIERQPSEYVLNNLGLAYEEQGNVSLACFYYSQALTKNESYSLPLFNLLYIAATHRTLCAPGMRFALKLYIHKSREQFESKTIAQDLRQKNPEVWAIAMQEAKDIAAGK